MSPVRDLNGVILSKMRRVHIVRHSNRADLRLGRIFAKSNPRNSGERIGERTCDFKDADDIRGRYLIRDGKLIVDYKRSDAVETGCIDGLPVVIQKRNRETRLIHDLANARPAFCRGLADVVFHGITRICARSLLRI